MFCFLSLFVDRLQVMNEFCWRFTLHGDITKASQYRVLWLAAWSKL